MTRLPKDEYFMRIAEVVATRSTCLRRAVGCVLVNERGHILATGYNGVARGQPHCNEPREFAVAPPLYRRVDDRSMVQVMETRYPNACSGAMAASGTALDACGAIHAEQNALLQCTDVFEIEKCYVTTEPCVSCTKLLLGTSCTEVIYREPYDGAKASKSLFSGANRTWTLLSR